jgi:hypothetical protein
VHDGVDGAAVGGNGQRDPPEEARAREEARPLEQGTEAGRGDRAKHDDGDEEIHDGSNHVGLSNRCQFTYRGARREYGAVRRVRSAPCEDVDSPTCSSSVDVHS